ncbi:MAG: hypothetical protein GY855_07475 [candidate division Zixibacteria bacterium]|nr:hypothetical protein [candidate division Zixibacteria bacterium]
METEILDKLEGKILKASQLIEKLRADNNELMDENCKFQKLEEEIKRLESEKDSDLDNGIQRENLIKSKIEDILKKLSVLEPREK